MIISASYKTDIPAFYGAWFMRRLEAGYCMMCNAYNRAQRLRVDLSPAAVDGIVFWTKNLGPFLDSLGRVERMGYPFYIQYAINGYPRALETSVADARRSVEHVARVAERFGSGRVVWRYDPIVTTSLTPLDFHRENFARLAASLEGLTDQAVVSFASIYKKTRRNMDAAAHSGAFTWRDPGVEEKQALLRDLHAAAGARGIALKVCSQPELEPPGEVVGAACCCDAARLAKISGRPVSAARRATRPGCQCYVSRDIGEYDTCPHGCVYCYAVGSPLLARRRHRQHDPAGEYLFPPAPQPPQPPAAVEPLDLF